MPLETIFGKLLTILKVKKKMTFSVIRVSRKFMIFQIESIFKGESLYFFVTVDGYAVTLVKLFIDQVPMRDLSYRNLGLCPIVMFHLIFSMNFQVMRSPTLIGLIEPH